MSKENTLNLFYSEPDPDRWFPGDRHLRKIIRRILRGKQQPGGVMRWFLNLKAGLDELGIKYRLNDFKYLKKNPQALALVIGKDQILGQIPRKNPIVFGPGIASHPNDTPFLKNRNIRLLLIPSRWFANMYKRDLKIKIPIAIWAAGIDTKVWKPNPRINKPKQILIYDKIRWHREKYKKELLSPIIQKVKNSGLQITVLRYGHYKEENYKKILNKVEAMIFLCEHETQGFAYLQALSCNIPILAWDRGGFWKDPKYFPKVKFRPVTSVPYWNKEAGITFKDFKEFNQKFQKFYKQVRQKKFQPRNYIIKKLTLKTASKKYVKIVKSISL